MKKTEGDLIAKLEGSSSDSSSESEKDEKQEEVAEEQPKSYADAVKESSEDSEKEEEVKEELIEEPKEETPTEETPKEDSVVEEPITGNILKSYVDDVTEPTEVSDKDEPVEETKDEPNPAVPEEPKEEPKIEEDEYDENKEIQRMIHQLSLDTQEKVNELDNLVLEQSQKAVPFDTKEYLDRQNSSASTKSADSTDGTNSKQTTFKEPERPKLEKQSTINKSRQSSISSWKDPVRL